MIALREGGQAQDQCSIAPAKLERVRTPLDRWCSHGSVHLGVAPSTGGAPCPDQVGFRNNHLQADAWQFNEMQVRDQTNCALDEPLVASTAKRL